MDTKYNNELLLISNYKKSLKERVYRLEKEGIKAKEIVEGSICENFNEQMWKTKKNSKISYDSKMSEYKYTTNSVHEYMYYSNFDINYNNLIDIKSQKVSIQFNAKSNIDLQLHILGYIGEKEVFHKIVYPNNEMEFQIEDNVRVRVGIRAKGIGTFSISKITINNRQLWLNQMYMNAELNKVIHDGIFNDDFKLEKKVEVCDRFEYNHDFNLIYSNLQGSQYEHIECSNTKNIEETDKYYDVFLHANKSEEVSLSMILLYKNEYEIIETIEIPYSSNCKIKISKDVKEINSFLKIRGSGYFSNVRLELEEYKYNPLKSIKLDLSKELFFNNFKKEVSLKFDKGLSGNINTNSGIVRYVSYMEGNNKFTSLPENNIISIDDEKIYKIFCNIKSEEGVQVLPMLIFYSNSEKIQVLQLLSNKEQEIKPLKGSCKVRLALRVSGKGEFIFNEFRIDEYEHIDTISNVEWSDKFELNKLGLSNGLAVKDMKIAVIMDEFTTACYEDECTLIKVTPENWKEELIESTPDFLFVESAWRGNGGVWFKKIGDYGEDNNKELNEMIKWCKLNNIPTLFWNKEDPVHFNRFVNTAKKFDYIFTTDSNSVQKYKDITCKDNVFALPFAAQPKKHNPIRLDNDRISKACFAGSYYKLHEERRLDMERVLDEVIEYGLDIYDRNFEAVKKGTMPNHTFPDRYKNCIKGNLKYYEIDKAYKGYKLMVNVNTVKYSPTMFSRRVYEGLACGTPVISSFSEGVEKMFEDIVYITKEEGDLKNIIPKLLKDDDYYKKVSIRGIREVLNKHTYTHRLEFILDSIGIKYKVENKKVTMIAIAKSESEYHKILGIYNRQEYKYKELVVLLDKFDGYIDIFKKYNRDGIYSFILSYMSNYNNISDIVSGEHISFIDSKNFYGKNYISDLILCSKYTTAEVIGKGSYYTIRRNKLDLIKSDKQYCYVKSIDLTAAICNKDIFKYDNIVEILNSYKKIELSKYCDRGIRAYSSDNLNFIQNYSNNGKNSFDTVVEF